MRRVVIVSAVAVVLALSSSPVAAGGSWFHADSDQLQPGDTVTMIGFTGGGQLGWIEDGPFFGYLSPEPDGLGGTVSWNRDDMSALIPLGELTLTETGTGGWQRLAAHLTFDVPADFDPGTYNFEYCNDPCTTGLGDLIGGYIAVGVAGDTADLADPLVAGILADEPLAFTGSAATSTLLATAVVLLALGAAARLVARRCGRGDLNSHTLSGTRT